MGATLALSFQFSLGTVFIIASQRVHPMWHTPILPAIFLASSIIAGLAMVIAGGTASSWIFGRSLSQDLVGKLVTWVPWALGLYLLVLFVDLFFVQDPILTWGVPSLLYMTELVVGTLIPLFIFTRRWVRDSRGWSFVGAAMILFGVLVNRLDVAWLSTASASGVIYMPSLMEIVIQMGVICVIILVYTLVGHYLPLFEGLSATKPHAAENWGVKPAL
jgi:Ni/Fe-hydrogenase subunit HybB-like protein